MEQKLEYDIVGGDFNLAGKASSKIKKKLKQLEVDSATIKRIVVATYEAELNVVAHARKGKITAFFEQGYIQIAVTDCGPGIENIELAMEEGFSTASNKVREMGLPNIKKNTDKLKIESKVGEGTKLNMIIFFGRK